MNRPSLFALSIILLTGCLSLRAQDDTSNEPTVSLQFCLYSWRGDTGALGYAPNQTVPMMEAYTRSASQNYSGPATLKFYAKAWKPTPVNGKPAPPAATVTFPQNTPRVTVLTAPIGHGRYMMYAIPEEGDSLPPHSIRLYNFTTMPLLLAYGDGATIELKPAGTAVVSADTAVVFHVAYLENGQWIRAFNNVAELNQDGRQNVILAPGIAGQKVSMFTLPPWPASPPPAQSQGSATD